MFSDAVYCQASPQDQQTSSEKPSRHRYRGKYFKEKKLANADSNSSAREAACTQENLVKSFELRRLCTPGSSRKWEDNYVDGYEAASETCDEGPS